MAARNVRKLFQNVREQLFRAVESVSGSEELFINGELLSGTKLSNGSSVYMLDFVGENAYSQTFKAKLLTDSEEATDFVTIKRMHPQWYGKKRVREHFKQEVDIVRDFLHPYLPRYIFQGELASMPCYAYRYVEGVPLTHMQTRKELYPPELVADIAPELVLKILKQLRYLHEQMVCVVHGYVGLRSLLLTPGHDISLIEFGCAFRKDRVIENDYRWVIDPRYCSPEQARQEVWDERSDLYQVGVVFYELLSGDAWNQSGDPEEQAVFAAGLGSMDKEFLAQYTSPQISALIADMLHPDASERPQHASICIDRLQEAISLS